MVGWVAGSCLLRLGCLGLKQNGIGPICFLSTTFSPFSPACSVHGRKLYRFSFLNLERFIPRLGNWIGNSSKQEQGDHDCKEEEEES